MGLDVVGGDFLACCFQRIGAASAYRHGRAALGKGERNRASNSATAASDDGALAGEVDVHVRAPLRIGAAMLPRLPLYCQGKAAILEAPKRQNLWSGGLSEQFKVAHKSLVAL